MDSKRPDRRRFLKNSVALAGLAVGAAGSVKGMALESEPLVIPPKDYSKYGDRSRFVTAGRADDYPTEVFPAKKLTPLQDSVGIITPAPLHFVANHSVPPDIDPQQYRLVLHGMVDRPMVFSLEDLKSLPFESRIHFLECIANSAPGGHGGRKESVESVQDIHGRTSCSEWTGVPLSVLLEAAGVQKGASWLVSEGGDSGRYSYSLPLEKAMDDVLVAYGQNGESVRPEQGFPLRLVVPGWEAPFSVKWLRQIKVVDRPYMTKFETVVHAYLRPDLKGKARWFDFEMPPKSVIIRPSGGQKITRRGFYEISGLAWSGRGVIRRVEVSTDGGRTWKDAKLQEPVHRKAHTRFRLDWSWHGEEAVLQSRCTDEHGDVQPSLEELGKAWGIANKEYWNSTSSTAFHFNAIQPWKVSSDGSVHNAMFA